MKRALFLVTALALAYVGACSAPDTSGLPRGTYMDQLTSEQIITFCAWGIQKQGGSGEHPCDGGTQKIMTIDECKAKRWPHCPLSMFEDCLDSLYDVCDPGPTGACTVYATCAKAHPALSPDAGLPGTDAGP
ncbi:MAG: hypothetical protein QM765_12045 [Myxococcales bacterium]